MCVAIWHQQYSMLQRTKSRQQKQKVERIFHLISAKLKEKQKVETIFCIQFQQNRKQRRKPLDSNGFIPLFVGSLSILSISLLSFLALAGNSDNWVAPLDQICFHRSGKFTRRWHGIDFARSIRNNALCAGAHNLLHHQWEILHFYSWAHLVSIHFIFD